MTEPNESTSSNSSTNTDSEDRTEVVQEELSESDEPQVFQSAGITPTEPNYGKENHKSELTPEDQKDGSENKSDSSSDAQSAKNQLTAQSTGASGPQFYTQGESIAISFQSFAGAESGAQFQDPTSDLPAQVDTPSLSINKYEHLLAVLLDRRAILLSSFEHQISFAAAYAIVRHSTFDTYERRLLTVERRSDKIDLSIDLFGRREYHDKKDQIILIEVNHNGSFLESLRTESCGEPARLRELLCKKNILLVFAASCELLGLTPDEPSSPLLPLYQCSIPYLYCKLAQRLPEERAVDIESLLLDQRRRKLWDDFPTTIDFFREVGNLLATAGQLETEIERRENLFRDRTSIESIEILKAVHPADFFTDGDELRSTVLYAATYFRDLTPNDFDKIVRLLLNDKTIEVEKESQIVNDKGEIQVRKEPVVRRLADIWRESPDRILRECYLEAVSRNGSLQVVDFSKGYLRRDLRVFLESKYPMFVARSFQRLQDSGILFWQDSSEKILDNLVLLSVERTLSDPSYYDRNWLVQVLLTFKSQLEADVDEMPEDLVSLLVHLGKNELVRRHFYHRLCQLIREMLRYEALRGAVRGFLNFLVSHERDTALDIVLELARRLRFAPEFEAYSWIRKLLDQGNSDVRERTYECLFTLVTESGIRLYGTLEAIRGWLPEPTRELERYSQSSRYALTFLPSYCFATAYNFPYQHYGEWPSRYPLFSALPDDISLAHAKLELLANWLNHPGLIVRLEDMTPEASRASFIADLMELWILILEGGGLQEVKSGAKALADALLEAFARHIDEKQHIYLVRRWQQQQQAYYKQVNLLPVRERAKRGILLAKRKKLLEVKQRFLQTGPRRP